MNGQAATQPETAPNAAPDAAAGTPPDEGVVTVEGMSNALDDLVKAADATDVINKGNGSGIEHSGHVDERGKVGGGRATASDAGGLDRMMIAKMSEVGIDLGMISSFNDYLVGKQTKEEEEEEETEEEKAKKAAELAATTEGQEPLIKSMDQFREDPEIAKAVDVSPYLENMTVKVADMIDGLRKAVSDSQGSQADVNRAMAAALYQMGTLLKSRDETIVELGKRLGIVERTPNPPRGKTALSGATPLNKAMAGEAGGAEPLSKSETISTLSYMNLEKSIKNIGPVKTSDAIYQLEGGNMIDPAVAQAVQNFLATNPTEAQAARAYQ